MNDDAFRTEHLCHRQSIQIAEKKKQQRCNAIIPKSKNMDPLNEAIAKFQIEPRHDKTNKMSVHPAKSQISLGIRPVG